MSQKEVDRALRVQGGVLRFGTRSCAASVQKGAAPGVLKVKAEGARFQLGASRHGRRCEPDGREARDNVEGGCRCDSSVVRFDLGE